jgi:hypothetical protein
MKIEILYRKIEFKIVDRYINHVAVPFSLSVKFYVSFPPHRNKMQ